MASIVNPVSSTSINSNSIREDILESLRQVTVQILDQGVCRGVGVAWTADGLIITNAHVVHGPATVRFHDGRTVRAELLYRDAAADLAALHIPGGGLQIAEQRDSQTLRTGEIVIAVGHPQGTAGAVSTGIVHTASPGGWIEADIRLAPGNSGGPLADAAGHVVGINSMVVNGMGVAVSTAAVYQFLSRPATGCAVHNDVADARGRRTARWDAELHLALARRHVIQLCNPTVQEGHVMRVLVIADSAIARTGLGTMLRGDGRFEPVGHDATFVNLGRSALLRADLHPDVILAEIADKRRLLSLAAPAEEATGPPMVLLVDDLNRKELLRVLGAGARAVLRRDAAPAEIFAALEACAAGLTVIGPDELDLIVPAASAAGAEDEPVLDALSAREAEILALMAQGLANKNIADRVHISEHTVKFHVSSILAKLGAASRTEAVTKALKDGLLII